MEELIFIKLGGSLITDKLTPMKAEMDTIKRLAREIHEARQEKKLSLIIGHGGGSFPHVTANKYQTQNGVINGESYRGIAEVQNMASKLNRIIIDAFLDAGESAVTISPSSSSIAEDGNLKEWYLKPLEVVLKNNMIPIPYGDVVIDEKKGCCIISTEKLLKYLANRMKPRKVILCGKVDGVLDNEGNVIKKITPNNVESIQSHLKASDGTDVTGGMDHKVKEALEFTKNDVIIEIINATKPDILKRALLGEDGLGTVISKN